MGSAIAPSLASASIEQIRPPREVDPRFAGGIAVSTELASTPESFGMFAELNPDAGYLRVPNYLGRPGELLDVPSLEVVTHRDAQSMSYRARIVDLHNADPDVAGLYRDATKARNGKPWLQQEVMSTAQRMMTNRGANGLHHIYGTRIADGGTVFYSVKEGPRVYLARIGTVENRDGGEPLPVLAVIGATANAKAEHRLWRIIGSARQDSKRRRNA